MTYKEELENILGADAVFILTREQKKGFINGRIDTAFIRENMSDFKKHFYICGPDPMVNELVNSVQESGASPEALVFEK
jgi:ferredoxin-NADP reductase